MKRLCQDWFRHAVKWVDTGCVALMDADARRFAELSAKVAELEQKAESGHFGIPGRVPESAYWRWIKELVRIVPGFEKPFEAFKMYI